MHSLMNTDFICTVVFFIFILKLVYKNIHEIVESYNLQHNNDIDQDTNSRKAASNQKPETNKYKPETIHFQVFYNICHLRLCELEYIKNYTNKLFVTPESFIFQIMYKMLIRDIKNISNDIYSIEIANLIKKKSFKFFKEYEKHLRLDNIKNLEQKYLKDDKKNKEKISSNKNQIKTYDRYKKNFFFFKTLEKANLIFKKFENLNDFNATEIDKINDLFIGCLNDDSFLTVEIFDKINALKNLFNYIDEYTQFAKNYKINHLSSYKKNKNKLNVTKNTFETNPSINLTDPGSHQKISIIAEENKRTFTVKNEKKELISNDKMQINENSNVFSIVDDEIFDENRFMIFHKLMTIKLMKVNINNKFWSDILLLLKDVFKINFYKSKRNSYHISFFIDEKTDMNTQKDTLYMDVFEALDFHKLDFMGLVHVAYEYADFFDNFIFRFLYQIYFCKSLKEIENIFIKEYIKYFILIENKKIFDRLPDDFEFHIKNTKIIKKETYDDIYEINILFSNNYELILF